MKYSFFFLFLLSSATTFSQKKKAVFIIVDGIPADLVEKLPTPGLDSIAGGKGYKRALVGGGKGTYNETPTISAVGYNSVLTGTWVNKHNVWGNYDEDIAHPNYHYKTIFRLLKDADPAKKIAIFSSWLDNRTKLVGESLPATGNIKFDFTYDGYELDTITYSNDTTSLRMHAIDEFVVNRAAATIKEKAPDLSWVYLEFTDDMGHMYGDGEKFYDAIKVMDNQVSRIWNAVRFRQTKFRENWLVIITTDHGRDSATGMNHGGQSEREKRGWIVTNAKNLNAHFTEDTISIVDIMPSIASFLNISFDDELKKEVDGTTLIGRVSATGLRAEAEGGVARLTWKGKEKGKGKVWIAGTNNFKTGGKDEYKLLGEVDLKNEHAEFKIGESNSGFYKVVLETPSNTLNCWIVAGKN
ncbi:MAG: alkaline phosphatase family protein [Chitinophagaceae bacterium]|nr:alkaline phosphatase family protein [Chitinophagaceae bacterium]